MPHLSMKELGVVAANIGHRDLRVVPMRSRGWFRAECSCGYRSARRNTPALAAEAAAHHVLKVAGEFVAKAQGNGHDLAEYLTPPAIRPLPDISDTPSLPTGEMLPASA